MEPSNIANPRFYRCPTPLVLHTPTLLRHAWLLPFKSWNDHLGLRPASKGSSRSVVRHVPRISLRMSVFTKLGNSTMGLASSEPNRLKFQFAELRQFEVHTVYGQTQRRINVGDYREIFDDIFPNKASKLRGSYSRCKRPGVRSGLALWPLVWAFLATCPCAFRLRRLVQNTGPNVDAHHLSCEFFHK